jgi:hypothetical protein
MRTILKVGYAVSLLAAFGGGSAAAIDVPVRAMPLSPVFATEVSARCNLWKNKCHELYPGRGWRFRRCMALHGCR